MKARLLSSMEAAFRYGVTLDTLRQWRNYKGFPDQAIIREGASVRYDVQTIDAWLRARPLSTRGRPPKWLGIIHGKAAKR